MQESNNFSKEAREELVKKWKKSGLLDDLSQPYVPKVNWALLFAPSDKQTINKPEVLPATRRILNQLPKDFDIVNGWIDLYEVDDSRIMF